MNYYKILFIILLLGFLFNGRNPEYPVQAQIDKTVADGKIGISTPSERDGASPVATTGQTHFVHQGTGWVAQTRAQLSMFKPYSWGTGVKAKTAGNQWVHIAIPYASYLDGTALYLQHAEFCVKSTNGADTKPVKIEVWDNEVRNGSWPIFWPGDNSYHCIWIDYLTPGWFESVGISVQLHFANTIDKITLYKAWIIMVP